MGASGSIVLQAEKNETFNILLNLLRTYRTDVCKAHPAQVIIVELVETVDALQTLISEVPSVLITLSILLGKERNSLLPNMIIPTFYESCATNLNDNYSMSTLHVDSSEEFPALVKHFMESHRLNTPSAISAECQELSSLDCMSPYLTNKQFMVSSLNVPNNQLTVQSLEASHTKQSQCLLQLFIGGNLLESMADIMKYMPSSLVLLDVSFTEGLRFPPGSFVSCPQLLHLCIDGCGISTTTYEEEAENAGTEVSNLSRECSKSMFFGLVSLVSLSMKDNALESVESIQGLSIFSLLTSDDVNESVGVILRKTTLRNICLADNPLCETSADLKQAISFIFATIPSLHTVDDKLVNSPVMVYNSVDRSSGAFRVQHQLDQQLREQEKGAAVVSDAMEREFTSALMVEKDNAVVA